ncbi:family 43 glycosylhydrolase [Gimesia aquarii]|uniref:Glycosyl hydrolases family 43 n=1 Tax=Gimesia aquarii TaxID=2527964 RepID=A0A517WNV0_9PLAN|nr:family 43 glycosylhydrolase [Gimesia aquarii]QDU06935.1 Glycosyl hydrolases family 43 [Gimesia aquarii]
MSSLIKFTIILILLQQFVWADSIVQCDFTRQFQVQLKKGSAIGEASLREHTIVWYPPNKKYYLLADVIPLSSKHHPNTYESEIHLFSSKDLSIWKHHGVAITKGKREGDFDRHGVASPVMATLNNGIIYCPYSARKTETFTQRSVGLAYSSSDPENIPWNKTAQPISDLPGEDDDVAIIKEEKGANFHLYHRSTGPEGYQIVHSESTTPLIESSWPKATPVAKRPQTVRAQELTGVILIDRLYHLLVIEHLYKGGVKIAHLASHNPAGPFHAFQKNQRYLKPSNQPKRAIYSGHITPVMKDGRISAFFWTAHQQGKRYGLIGHPVLKKLTP